MSILYPDVECASPDALKRLQLQKLIPGLSQVAERNRFYRTKWERAGVSAEAVRELDELSRLPLTEKSEFLEDQEAHPIYGTNLTEPFHHYVRYHQTTGTTGRPLKWLDTRESWDWRGTSAAMALAAAGVERGDSVFFAFPFSPHVAFWGLFEGALKLGALTCAGGGWTTEQRLKAIMENEFTVLACTPTYALHLAQVAAEKGYDLAASRLRLLIHGGEPGAMVPHVRQRLVASFGARPFDYMGLTEVGAHSFMCEARVDALHLIESAYIAEVIDPATGAVVPEGEVGELVLTNLGRWASPAVRYRTGDLVRIGSGRCACGRTFRSLEGGVLGRRDQMVVIRGVNVFPDTVGRTIGPLLRDGEEWEVVAHTDGNRDCITVNLELQRTPAEAEAVVRKAVDLCKLDLELSIDVVAVAPASIERTGAKVRRFRDLRPKARPA